MMAALKMDFAPFPSISAKGSALRAPQLTRASDGGAALPPTSSPGAWGSATRLAGLVRVLCVRLPAAVPFPCASDDSADVFGGARDLQRWRAQHLFTTPSGVRPCELGRKVAAGSPDRGRGIGLHP